MSSEPTTARGLGRCGGSKAGHTGASGHQSALRAPNRIIVTDSTRAAAVGTAFTEFPINTEGIVGNDDKRPEFNGAYCQAALRPFLTVSQEYSREMRCAGRDANSQRNR